MTNYSAERDRKSKRKLDPVTKSSLIMGYPQPSESLLSTLLGGFKTLWTRLGSLVRRST